VRRSKFMQAQGIKTQLASRNHGVAISGKESLV
jgi:hypothetical protein